MQKRFIRKTSAEGMNEKFPSDLSMRFLVGILFSLFDEWDCYFTLQKYLIMFFLNVDSFLIEPIITQYVKLVVLSWYFTHRRLYRNVLILQFSNFGLQSRLIRKKNVSNSNISTHAKHICRVRSELRNYRIFLPIHLAAIDDFFYSLDSS